MKLEDWMKSEELGGCGDYEGYGYHVIRTCGECKYWGDRDIAWDEDARPYRSCENKNVNIFSPMQRCSNEFSKDFGCIHFEAKGEK